MKASRGFNVVMIAWAGLLAYSTMASGPFAEQISESEIRSLRMGAGIPDDERDMSIDQLISLLGRDGYHWADYAVLLRCRLADDRTRTEIYDKLADLAIPVGDTDEDQQRMARTSAVTVLGLQREHRDQAIAALQRVIGQTHSLLARDGCYRSLGALGGPEAIEILKQAILAGPPKGAMPGGIQYELHWNLYMYLGSCGPDATPVLFEIARKMGMEDSDLLWAALPEAGDGTVVAFLLEKARAATSEWSRNEALRAACTKARGAPPETRQRIADMLIKGANSEDVTVRQTTAWGLGVVGNATHIALLDRMAAEDPYSSVGSGIKGGQRYEKQIYPVREAAAKSIEQIRARFAKEQTPSTP